MAKKGADRFDTALAWARLCQPVAGSGMTVGDGGDIESEQIGSGLHKGRSMAIDLEKCVAAVKQSGPENWSTLLAAFAASYGIGSLGFVAMPFMLGATIDGLGLSTAQAGLLGTAEFTAMMLGSFAVSPFISRVPRKGVALGGAILAILANIGCASVHPLHYGTALVLRALAGTGCGLSLAAGNATVANARDPERMAAHMSTLFVVMMVVSCLIFPWAAANWGYAGVYLALAALMLLLCPLLMALPQHAPRQVEKTERDHPAHSAGALAAAAILVALLIYAMRDMSAWAFVERLGLEAGYTTDQVGRLLSAEAVIGIAGPLVASFLGSRWGLTMPIIFGILAAGAPYYFMLLMPGSKLVYTAAALFIAGAYYFTQSYLIALAAELDRKGRIVAAAGGFMSGGAAIGPALGGYLIERFGYWGTSWASLLMIVLTLLLALLSLGARKTPVAMPPLARSM